MKPSPQLDFPIVFHDEEGQHWDHPHPEAFAGIYSVVLNHTTTVYFVPRVAELARDWPPEPVEDYDAITTKRAARPETLQLGYVSG